VVGREVVEDAGGDVLLVSLVPGQSTTRLVHRSAESAAPDKRVSKPAES
jgi:bifunctional ADP-heptose synthase (sugar kinase/adenylyltransferase)